MPEKPLCPVTVKESHFPVFPEFQKASYAKRYELLCLKLVRERLYDGACLLLSDRETGPSGASEQPSAEVGLKRFVASLTGHAHAFARLRS